MIPALLLKLLVRALLHTKKTSRGQAVFLQQVALDNDLMGNVNRKRPCV